jgi:intracellular septation protein A
MNELLTITPVIMLLTINLVPFFIALRLLFPVRTARTSGIANQQPGRSFAIGLVNFVFFVVIGLATASLVDKTPGLLKIIPSLLAILSAVCLFISLAFGLAGISGLIGERLAPSQNGWKQELWGVLLLGLGGSVPLLGWFMLLPYAIWTGMGAFIISLAARD